jgi:AbrB family looped-hinge helix DNA binding protein
MASIATTRLSSKGQVVIPEDVRKALRLETGARFVVMGDGDVVILKRISAPTRREFGALSSRVRGQARLAGMKRADIQKAVRSIRRRG